MERRVGPPPPHLRAQDPVSGAGSSLCRFDLERATVPKVSGQLRLELLSQELQKLSYESQIMSKLSERLLDLGFPETAERLLDSRLRHLRTKHPLRLDSLSKATEQHLELIIFRSQPRPMALQN